MDKATQTTKDNLHKNTGKTLTVWVALVKKGSFEKHEIVRFLKERYAFTHGYAMCSHKINLSTADTYNKEGNPMEKKAQDNAG